MAKLTCCLLSGLCLLGAASTGSAAPPAGTPAADIARDRVELRGRSAAEVRTALQQHRAAGTRSPAAAALESRRGLLDEHERLAPRSERGFGLFRNERHPSTIGLERAAATGRAAVSLESETRPSLAGRTPRTQPGLSARTETETGRSTPDPTPLDRAERLLATRLAQIDRMRDRALEEGNEHLLDVADHLEQIARRQHDHRLSRLDDDPADSPPAVADEARLNGRLFGHSTAARARLLDAPETGLEANAGAEATPEPQ